MSWVLIYTVNLAVCSYHVENTFQNKSTLYSCLNVKKLLAQNRHNIWSLSDCNETWTQNHFVRKQTLNDLSKLANDWAVLWVLICMVHLAVCSYHVTYTYQSESTLYSCLNVKKLLAWNRHNIWSLSDCNETWTQNHFVRKQTLNDLSKLAKWLSCNVSNYLYCAFECMFLPCHRRISEWFHTP